MESVINVRSPDADKSYSPIFQVLFNMGRVHQTYPLPNLRSLKWTVRSSGELIDIAGLIVPTLDHFTLELYDLPPQFLRNIYRCSTARIPYITMLADRSARSSRNCARNGSDIDEPTNHLFLNSNAYKSPPILSFHPSSNVSKMPNLCDMDIGLTSVFLPV